MATLVRYNRPTFFNPFYTRPVVTRFYNTRPAVPAVNVNQTEAAYTLALATPGLKKDDLKINVENNVLTIAYKPETTEGNDAPVQNAFGVQPFERSFRLPKTVDAEQITAGYTDGVLTLTLPKAEETNVVKEIAIA